MDGTTAAITEIAGGIAKYGTTSFFPTTMTMEKDAIYRSLAVIRELQGIQIKVASVLGAHLEGPFINTNKYDGVQNYLEFTKRVKAETGITLSIGHSTATYT